MADYKLVLRIVFFGMLLNIFKEVLCLNNKRFKPLEGSYYESYEKDNVISRLNQSNTNNAQKFRTKRLIYKGFEEQRHMIEGTVDKRPKYASIRDERANTPKLKEINEKKILIQAIKDKLVYRIKKEATRTLRKTQFLPSVDSVHGTKTSTSRRVIRGVPEWYHKKHLDKPNTSKNPSLNFHGDVSVSIKTQSNDSKKKIATAFVKELGKTTVDYTYKAKETSEEDNEDEKKFGDYVNDTVIFTTFATPRTQKNALRNKDLPTYRMNVDSSDEGENKIGHKLRIRYKPIEAKEPLLPYIESISRKHPTRKTRVLFTSPRRHHLGRQNPIMKQNKLYKNYKLDTNFVSTTKQPRKGTKPNEVATKKGGQMPSVVRKMTEVKNVSKNSPKEFIRDKPFLGKIGKKYENKKFTSNRKPPKNIVKNKLSSTNPKFKKKNVGNAVVLKMIDPKPTIARYLTALTKEGSFQGLTTPDVGQAISTSFILNSSAVHNTEKERTTTEITNLKQTEQFTRISHNIGHISRDSSLIKKNLTQDEIITLNTYAKLAKSAKKILYDSLPKQAFAFPDLSDYVSTIFGKTETNIIDSTTVVPKSIKANNYLMETENNGNDNKEIKFGVIPLQKVTDFKTNSTLNVYTTDSAVLTDRHVETKNINSQYKKSIEFKDYVLGSQRKMLKESSTGKITHRDSIMQDMPNSGSMFDDYFNDEKYKNYEIDSIETYVVTNNNTRNDINVHNVNTTFPSPKVKLLNFQSTYLENVSTEGTASWTQNMESTTVSKEVWAEMHLNEKILPKAGILKFINNENVKDIEPKENTREHNLSNADTKTDLNTERTKEFFTNVSKSTTVRAITETAEVRTKTEGISVTDDKSIDLQVDMSSTTFIPVTAQTNTFEVATQSFEDYENMKEDLNNFTLKPFTTQINNTGFNNISTAVFSSTIDDLFKENVKTTNTPSLQKIPYIKLEDETISSDYKKHSNMSEPLNVVNILHDYVRGNLSKNQEQSVNDFDKSIELTNHIPNPKTSNIYFTNLKEEEPILMLKSDEMDDLNEASNDFNNNEDIHHAVSVANETINPDINQYYTTSEPQNTVENELETENPVNFTPSSTSSEEKAKAIQVLDAYLKQNLIPSFKRKILSEDPDSTRLLTISKLIDNMSFSKIFPKIFEEIAATLVSSGDLRKLLQFLPVPKIDLKSDNLRSGKTTQQIHKSSTPFNNPDLINFLQILKHLDSSEKTVKSLNSRKNMDVLEMVPVNFNKTNEENDLQNDSETEPGKNVTDDLSKNTVNDVKKLVHNFTLSTTEDILDDAENQETTPLNINKDNLNFEKHNKEKETNGADDLENIIQLTKDLQQSKEEVAGHPGMLIKNIRNYEKNVEIFKNLRDTAQMEADDVGLNTSDFVLEKTNDKVDPSNIKESFTFLEKNPKERGQLISHPGMSLRREKVNNRVKVSDKGNIPEILLNREKAEKVDISENKTKIVENPRISEEINKGVVPDILLNRHDGTQATGELHKQKSSQQSVFYNVKPTKSILFMNPVGSDENNDSNKTNAPIATSDSKSKSRNKNNIPYAECGLVRSPESSREGSASLKNYPWLGLLVYPKGEQSLVTTVVLITAQLVIAPAWEILRIPKRDFRKSSKVYLDYNVPDSWFNVLTYNHHPDFHLGYPNTISLIQIDTKHLMRNLQPICGPPKFYTQPKFFAFALGSNYGNAVVEVYRMKHVPLEACKQHFRTFTDKYSKPKRWPRHFACGRATRGGQCVWQFGSVLVVKQADRWHLLGLAISGAGCESPTRYIDYGLYARWIKTSIARTNQPAITRMAPNKLVMRRSLGQIQRFGPCDIEELNTKLNYSSAVHEKPTNSDFGLAHHNIMLLNSIDYACVEIKAEYISPDKRELKQFPQVDIRRVLPTRGEDGIEYNVSVMYDDAIKYQVISYGRPSQHKINTNNAIIEQNLKIEMKNETTAHQSHVRENRMEPNVTRNSQNYVMFSPNTVGLTSNYVQRKVVEKSDSYFNIFDDF